MNTEQQASLQNAPDLNATAPRSLRCQLGGYAVLPRLLDKCRAQLAGTIGDYHFNCPLDQQFLSFTEITAEAIKEQVAAGLTDDEILEWVEQHASPRCTPWEISQWSSHQGTRMPEPNTESKAYFSETLEKLSRTRRDIHTWADLLDLDDYQSFLAKN